MGVLYAENGKIFTREYLEVYIPKDYFDSGIATNHGATVETFGIGSCRIFKGDEPGEMQLFDVPVNTELTVYNTRNDTIQIKDRMIDVLCLEYLPKSEVMHQSLPKGREVSNAFLSAVLAGKLPSSINYADTINMWWENLEIAGISYKVPATIYEMILASTYRNPNNPKERYGQLYGRQDNPTGYDYETANVRNVVKQLSTFSGMVFEDMGSMVSSGILNAENNVEEPVSPLEKIIHY